MSFNLRALINLQGKGKGNYMKTFSIGVFEEQSGYLTVQAKSKREAEKIAEEFLETYGVDTEKVNQNHPVKGYEPEHREVYLI